MAHTGECQNHLQPPTIDDDVYSNAKKIPWYNVLTSPEVKSTTKFFLMTEDLARIWDVDSFGIAREENSEADSISYLIDYQRNCLTFSDCRYTARLSWGKDHEPLPTNLQITKKRTESTIRRLSKDP
ncbi:hypothetical protein MAR_005374, partial [Mya arenaria]